MGNSGQRGFLPLLRRLARDPGSDIAGHAEWALRRLEGRHSTQ